MTEKELMQSGLPYSAVDVQLLRELNATKEVIHRYNALQPSQTEELRSILKSLLGHIGDDHICINQPFYCDYGKQIRVGKRFFANFNFTVLDEAPVTIGDDCFIGYLHRLPQYGSAGAQQPAGMGRARDHRRQCMDWRKRDHPSGREYWQQYHYWSGFRRDQRYPCQCGGGWQPVQGDQKALEVLVEQGQGPHAGP